MRESVSTEQIKHYREHGFLHVAGFLDAHELEQWRSAVTAEAERRLERPLDGQPAGHFPTAYQNVFLQLMLMSRTSADVRDLMHDERLGRLGAVLTGAGGIHIWHDQALIKEPLANPTSLHRDVPYWSFDSFDAISIWVALDEATLQNGCLYFLPGSQRMTDFESVGIGENMGELVAKYPALAAIEPVAVPCSAGDAIFIDGMVAHGAGPNMTRGYRRAMTCAYMPKGARYNGKKNILSDAYRATLSIGDVLDNEAELPLLFESVT